MEFFNLHTHQVTNQGNVLELVNQYPHEFDSAIAYYSIGIHPWYIEENRLELDLKIIEEKIQTPNCLAIGECGLDKKIEQPLALQLLVFEKQLALAQKYKKPVVIHCVAAFQELITLKKKMKISVPMIIHGFAKKAPLAAQLIKEGFYLSFGKDLMQNPALQSVFKNTPNDRFFLETDIMNRTIGDVYDAASNYKELCSSELNDIISSNFKVVFQNEALV